MVLNVFKARGKLIRGQRSFGFFLGDLALVKALVNQCGVPALGGDRVRAPARRPARSAARAGPVAR
jgi:hypothetical protein